MTRPVALSPELDQGWLALQCDQERHRVCPIPDGWLEATEETLGAILTGAGSVGTLRRLVE